jgi:hypothetical protein
MMAEPIETVSRRRPLLLALGATLFVALFRGRGHRDAPGFVERTVPGDRYRTFPLGDRSLYVREDLLRTGWFRDFRYHDGRRCRR